MSPASRPSKQKRAAENRAVRQARAARRENASQRAADAVRSAEPVRGRHRTRAKPSSDRAAAGGEPARRPGLLGMLAGGGAGGRAPHLDEAPDPDDTTGRRAAFFAIFAAVAATIGLAFFPIPVDADGEPLTRDQQEALDDADDDYDTDRAIDAIGPTIFIYGLPLVGVSGFAVFSLRRPRRSRALLVCLIAAAVFVLLNGSIGLLFLPAAGAIAVARTQVRRREMAEHAAAQPASARDDGDREVIEADVVDDDDREVIDADVVHDDDREVIETDVVRDDDEPEADEPGEDDGAVDEAEAQRKD